MRPDLKSGSAGWVERGHATFEDVAYYWDAMWVKVRAPDFIGSKAVTSTL